MADNNTHINYSVADIERYLHGGMSAKEMHDMEKAALQDPFLADAIEGYSEADFSQSHVHLNEINAVLQRPVKEQAKVVEMPAKKFRWLSAAAMIAVLAGVGAVTLYLTNKNSIEKNASLAQEKATAPMADTLRAADENKTETVKIDSAFIKKEKTSTVVIADNSKALKKNTDKASLSISQNDSKPLNDFTSVENKEAISAAAADRIINQQTDSAKAVESLIAQNQVNNQPKPVQEQLQGSIAGIDVSKNRLTNSFKSGTKSNNMQLNSFTGKVYDNNNLPVPNATIKLKNSNTATVTDINGYFNFKAQDSVAKIIILSVGNEPADAVVKNNSANRITVNESEQSLAETVVIGFGAKKKEVQRDKIKKPGDSAVVPVNGWDSFEEYVYKKLNKKYDSTADLADVKGDVELEFLVDRQGKPYDVKVVRSLNEDADNKAIEILKQGPNWTSDNKKKKGKVTIHF